MPQLDPTSFPSQLFWLTVSFVVLYVLLARFLLPRVQSVIGLRTETLEGNIAQANRMKTESEAAKEAYEKALVAARAESQAEFASAQAKASVEAAKQQAELDKVIEKKISDAEAAIQAAKQGVVDKLNPVAGELAALIVEMLVHHKPNVKDMTAVISEMAKTRTI